MYFELILAIVIIRYLRKTLHTEGLYTQWDKIFAAGLAVSIALIVMEAILSASTSVVTWLTYALLAYLVYIILTQKEFFSVKSLIYAILPYIVISFAGSCTKLISSDFYDQWDNYFETAELFAFIWMVAMFFMTRKQKKALEVEQVKTKEKEKEYQITEQLKAALEVQVAERTAALTLQKEELQQALNELKATQAQLIQSEKMASLGELTAGIAHEIQNPLNFVNNFSELNKELIDEMEQEFERGNVSEAKLIAKDIKENEQKINHHGKRADAIVKGMLQHSRSSNSIKEPSDINALADEYLRLAYHGLRAKDKLFNATMKTSFDESIGKIKIIPQDIGRAILNLITNAFYAVGEKKKQLQNGFEPTVWVSTIKQDGKVEIKIKDNGNGIPQKVLDKIFQPFYTTKPTGQGTGLGLSLSYDIIKTHGGELQVHTKEGEFAEFIIILPQ